MDFLCARMLACFAIFQRLLEVCASCSMSFSDAIYFPRLPFFQQGEGFTASAAVMTPRARLLVQDVEDALRIPWYISTSGEDLDLNEINMLALSETCFSVETISRLEILHRPFVCSACTLLSGILPSVGQHTYLQEPEHLAGNRLRQC